jgi:hypothetical protein
MKVIASLLVMVAADANAHPGHGLLPHLPSHGVEVVPMLCVVALIALAVVERRLRR